MGATMKKCSPNSADMLGSHISSIQNPPSCVVRIVSLFTSHNDSVEGSSKSVYHMYLTSITNSLVDFLGLYFFTAPQIAQVSQEMLFKLARQHKQSGQQERNIARISSWHKSLLKYIKITKFLMKYYLQTFKLLTYKHQCLVNNFSILVFVALI